jgi:hypothetical protein
VIDRLAEWLTQWARDGQRVSYIDVFLATGKLTGSHPRTNEGKALRNHLFGSGPPTSAVVAAAIGREGNAMSLAEQLEPILLQGMNAPFGALTVALTGGEPVSERPPIQPTDPGETLAPTEHPTHSPLGGPSRESLSDVTNTAGAVNIIREFLHNVVSPDNWVWESLIETIAANTELGQNGRMSEAIYASACALRKTYPHKNVKPEDHFRRLSGISEMVNIWKIVDSEFRRVSRLPLSQRICDIASVYARADQLLGSSGILYSCLKQMLGSPRKQHVRSSVSPSKGVYGLWRAEDIELPIYVGEGHLQSRLNSHLEWWGTPPMYVTFLNPPEFQDDAMRLLVERFLIVVVQPGINKK